MISLGMENDLLDRLTIRGYIPIGISPYLFPTLIKSPGEMIPKFGENNLGKHLLHCSSVYFLAPLKVQN